MEDPPCAEESIERVNSDPGTRNSKQHLTGSIERFKNLLGRRTVGTSIFLGR